MAAHTIIICSHNGGERLPRVIDSALAAAANHDCELVAVNSASTDTTGALIEMYGGRGIRPVHVAVPGLNRAREAGLANSSGDLVILVDDDNIIEPDYVSNAERLAIRYPTAVAFGGLAVAVGAREAALPPWFRRFEHFYGCGPQADDGGILGSPSFLRGAGLIVRRAAWQRAAPQVELTDRVSASLSTGGDVELCFLLQIQGGHLVYDPSLRLFHIMSPERLRRSYLLRLALENGRASVHLDRLVDALTSWRRRPWYRELLHSAVRHSWRPNLDGLVEDAWAAGRVSELAKTRRRYNVPATTIDSYVRSCRSVASP